MFVLQKVADNAKYSKKVLRKKYIKYSKKLFLKTVIIWRRKKKMKSYSASIYNLKFLCINIIGNLNALAKMIWASMTFCT